jgi:hypothetical protein
VQWCEDHWSCRQGLLTPHTQMSLTHLVSPSLVPAESAHSSSSRISHLGQALPGCIHQAGQKVIKLFQTVLYIALLLYKV